MDYLEGGVYCVEACMAMDELTMMLRGQPKYGILPIRVETRLCYFKYYRPALY